MTKFGPAGNSPLFYQSGGKTSAEVPAWLKSIGLNAYEYQCGRGVRIKEQTAKEIGDAARKYDIAVSIHAPYYINLVKEDREALGKSQNHIMKSLYAASWMGASTVVFHPGGVGKMDRKEALLLAQKNLEETVNLIQQKGLSQIKLAPETMGKRNQLGTVEEVLALCQVADNIVPTVDFAHLHAVSGGGLTAREHFEEIVDRVEAVLGMKVLKNLHVHFSPIEYTAGGEKRHRNLEDEGFGPDFSPLAEIIKERNLSPTIICESSDRQAEDAIKYMETLEKLQ
ncbi:TIM barrel protein [Metallumcola ferriviriculae]|uniref:TIM barrel protein n=1 Tax=Metallumcola ferriviriculae TaxID=3039180 RepID=A0AAU0UMS1_9FIRM|nr:TIM barrel protein [Desulfitibacteraceae bacterium MK1]